jgi:TadE-like protein
MAQIRESQEASHTSGTVAIEYALILPVLLLFTLGIMDTGRLLWTYITLTRATEAAARCGAVNTAVSCPAPNGACCTPIPSYAATAAWGLNDVTAGMFTVTTPQCGGAQPAGRSNVHFPIYHPLVSVVRGISAVWRPYHDAQCDGVLSEAIIRANGLSQLTPIPAPGFGGVERLIGRRDDGLRGLGNA